MDTTAEDTRLVKIALVLLAAFVVLPMVAMGFALIGFGSMMGGSDHGMWGAGMAPGWMTLLGILLQLLFIAALVGGGYLVYRAVAGSDAETDQALEELRLAYARGDLTDEEYERRREKLDGGS